MEESYENRDRPRPQNFSLTNKFMAEWNFEASSLGLSRNEFIKLLFLYYIRNKNIKKFINNLREKYLKEAIKK